MIAVDDAEAIVVDERFLSRMQKRYPRIGARIFLNIAKILSDRLDEALATRGDVRGVMPARWTAGARW